MSTMNWDADRRRMVDAQLRASDIHDPRVIDAMLSVPRHLFVPEPQRAGSYGDIPLPIGHGQTISQPYIVAFMTQALDMAHAQRVLDSWRHDYNHKRPHGALGHLTPSEYVQRSQQHGTEAARVQLAAV